MTLTFCNSFVDVLLNLLPNFRVHSSGNPYQRVCMHRYKWKSDEESLDSNCFIFSNSIFSISQGFVFLSYKRTDRYLQTWKAKKVCYIYLGAT